MERSHEWAEKGRDTPDGRGVMAVVMPNVAPRRGKRLTEMRKSTPFLTG
ncbi:MAG: hypothetical protein ABF969_01125 [Sporolactobacillus sp.]